MARALHITDEVIDQPELPMTKRQLKRLGQCVYCGRPAEQIDHIIPRARRGAKLRGNKVPICARCNHAKGDKPPIVFIKELLKVNGLPFTPLPEMTIKVPKFKAQPRDPEQVDEPCPWRLKWHNYNHNPTPYSKYLEEHRIREYIRDNFCLSIYCDNGHYWFQLTDKRRVILEGDLLILKFLGYSIEEFQSDPHYDSFSQLFYRMDIARWIYRRIDAKDKEMLSQPQPKELPEKVSL